MKKGISIRRFMSLLLVIVLCTGVALTTASCTLFSDDAEVSEAKEKKDKDKKKDKKKNKKKDKEKEKDKNKDIDIEEPPTSEPMAETFTYGVYTFTIPEEWFGKYYIKEEDGNVYIYQKASYDKEENLGFLCGFWAVDEIEDFPGDTLLAFSKDKFYYLSTPTDVPCYLEDKEISTEYGHMCIDIDYIKDSLIIDDDVCTRPDDYVIPNSDTLKISDYYCCNLNAKDLWLARNELFARHGMQFDNSYLQDYFAKKPWYTNENKKVTEDDLTDVEKENLALIKEAEDQIEKSDYPKKLKFGKEYSEDLDADGTKEKIKVTAKQNSTYEYFFDISIFVDGKEYIVDDIGCGIDTPETDGYYLTQIRPYFGELQIVLLDWGPSDDLVSHYFDYEDGKLNYLDCLSGFTVKEYMGFDPFCDEGCVITEERLDILTYTHYYGQVWYDRDKHEFRDQTYGQCEISGSQEHKTLKDIKVYAKETSMETITIPKDTIVYFISQDPDTRMVKIRTKDGTEGFIKSSSFNSEANVAPENDEVVNMFDNINFCD